MHRSDNLDNSTANGVPDKASASGTPSEHNFPNKSSSRATGQTDSAIAGNQVPFPASGGKRDNLGIAQTSVDRPLSATENAKQTLHALHGGSPDAINLLDSKLENATHESNNLGEDTVSRVSSLPPPPATPNLVGNTANHRVPLSHAVSSSTLPYSTANTSSVNVSAVDNNRNSDPAGESIATATLANNAKQINPPKSHNSKQKATRTDFFAAKLASAVDDVESSDSDETFVYENSDFHKTDGVNANGAAFAGGDANSVHGSFHAPHWPNSPLDARPGGLDPPSSIHHSVIGNESSPMMAAKSSRLGQSSGTHSRKAASMAGSFSSHQLQDVQSGGGAGNGGRLLIGPGGQEPTLGEPFHSQLHKSGSGVFSVHSPAADHDETAAERSKTSSRDPILTKDLNGDLKRGGIDAGSSVNERFMDDRYSFDEVDDECTSFDVESMGGYANRAEKQEADGACGSGGTNSSKKDALELADSASARPSLLPGFDPDAAKNVYAQRFRSSTTNSSSKLRSTTLKLFDKKGSQPRRYSIIPDDIDIEDFDDDLIYYDQNIRFPHTSGAPSSEFSPLMQNHKIPHYRSLNLNLHGSKRPPPLPGKRFASTGQPLRRSNGVDGGMVGNSHGYPFSPYQETPIYYDDIAEYDEAAYIDNPVHYGIADSPQSRKSLNRLTRYSRPVLNDGKHFLMPRKASDGTLAGGETSLIGSFIYTLVSIMCILGIGFIMGFVLASTKDLAEVSVVLLDNAIVSQDELVFNIVIEAVNPGWFSVGMNGLEVDVFAKSGFLREAQGGNHEETQSESVETVLLGTIYSMDPYISFPGGIFTHSSVPQLGEVKLLNPGKNLTALIVNGNDNSTDSDNSEKWAVISRNPFDLVVRGVFKYSLPFSTGQRSAVIQKTQYIDPEDPPRDADS